MRLPAASYHSATSSGQSGLSSGSWSMQLAGPSTWVASIDRKRPTLFSK